jgi:hypothetical protein
VDQVYAQVKEDGIRLGVSIGAYILEYDFKDKDKGYWGGLIINKVLLVETSIVGIPANQRSWVQNAAMAIAQKHYGLTELFGTHEEPEFRLEKRLWKILNGEEEAPLMATKIASLNIPEGTTATVGEAGVEDVTIIETKSGDPVTEEPQVTETAPVEESTVELKTESAEDTDETDAETTEDETSEALEEAAPDIALSLSAGTTPAVELVLAALEQAASELHAIRAEKATLEGQLAIVTGERDQALTDVESAAQIIALVARSPLGRKTQFAGPVDSFAQKFGEIYDAAFLKLLEQE